VNNWEREYVELLEVFPRLGDDWFARKLELAKGGHEESRVQIVGASLWVAFETAKEFEGLTPLGLPELTREANLALLDAINSYLGEDAGSYEAHVESTIRDRLLKVVLRRPAMVA